MTRVALVALLAACGGDGLAHAPATVSAGPVTLDTQTLTLSIGALSIDHFVAVGETTSLDASHYYDPRGEPGVTFAVPERARGVDGDWLVLDDGTRLRLAACEAFADCAALDVDASRDKRAVQLQLTLPKDPAEPLYGTGDAPARANVAGTVRELETRLDVTSESSTNETHVPVPLVMWPRKGVAMFVADDRPGALDLGATAPDRVTATFTLPARGAYRVYLYTGAAPLDLVRGYVALTAKPAVPPRWAFAPQQWRNEWASSDEARGDALAMRTRHIPGSVMWIDNPWQTAYNTFDIDPARFAQPAQLIADLAAQGYKVVFWSTPYVNKDGLTAPDFADGVARHAFITDDSDLPFVYPWSNGPGALVDFTHDGATEWWRAKIAKVTALGAAGFKLDFGEEVVPDVGGSIVAMELAAGDNETFHNRYAAGYHAAYLGAVPPGDGFLITRAGTWGEQATNTAIWPGDLDSDFSEHGVDNGSGKANVGGLPSAISRGLSLSVSGYPFYGSDIGGFRGFPTTEALVRWAEYAALGTIMQLGGGGTSHDPWDTTLFDPGTDAIYRTYAQLHMELNPLLWTLALAAGRDGTPVTRPARFVADCACDDATFLLGDDIVVAPVILAGATTRSAVLPPGGWFDRTTGLTTNSDGQQAVTVPAPLDTLPMWYRAASLVPMFARAADTLLPATATGVTSYVDPTLGRELRLLYTPGAATATAELHDGTHASATGPTILVTGGSEYTVITVDVDTRSATGPLAAPAAVAVDGSDLAKVADVTACAAPGCWSIAGTHLEVRVFADTAHAVVVR